MPQEAFFVVAFGHGADVQGGQPQEAARDLRLLIDQACDATFGRFPEHVEVSVAPGGVMLAFADGNPDRVVQLCRAIVSQLEGEATAYLPVCAVVTYGPMRPVDVLGYATNFEGQPAIAAARILARLSAGQMAIAQSVGRFTSLDRHLGPVTTLPGKHDGESFQVRFHQQIRFPIVSRGSPPEAGGAPAAMSYETFTHKVKQEIRALLQDPRLHPLREALAPQADGVGAEDVLVPSPSAPLIRALDHLHQATERCLSILAVQHSDWMPQTRAVAEKIFGWLVILAVNRDQMQEAGLAFDPWQGGITVQVPVATEAGIEVLMAALGDRAAAFIRQDDSHHGPRIFGQGGLTADELERGIGATEPLEDILKHIWVKVMETEEAPTAPLSDEQKQQLEATIKNRERRKARHYYITVPAARSHSPWSDRTLLTRLLQTLPSLRCLQITGGENQQLWLIDEADLWASIAEFLRLLRDVP